MQTLNDDNHVEIFPFDPNSSKLFKKIKIQIERLFDHPVEVVHRGATSLGISGQGELDVYLPVAVEKMGEYSDILTTLFGAPKKIHPGDRARFVAYVEGTKAEVFVMNEKAQGWVDGLRFENYLLKHPDALDEYRKLKEDGAGLSTRKYYTRKAEFINDILNRITAV